MRAAKEGDYAALKSEIARRHQAGSISNGEAADLARAVASRELRAAKPEDALARIRETRSCAGDLDDALADRQKLRDRASGEAAMIRLETMESRAPREIVADFRRQSLAIRIPRANTHIRATRATGCAWSPGSLWRNRAEAAVSACASDE